MIQETIPELKKLTEEERLLLISELWEGLLKAADDIPVTERVLDDADDSLRDYHEDPSRARSWEEVKRSIKSSRK